jgi:hypothetical protein
MDTHQSDQADEASMLPVRYHSRRHYALDGLLETLR